MHFDTLLRRASVPTAAANLCLLSLQAQAQMPALFNDHSPSGYVQAAIAENEVYTATIGLTLPWKQWTYAFGSGKVTGHWDLFASRWSARLPTRRDHSYVFGVVPTLRWRADQGRSSWFIQAGTGLSLGNKYYQNIHKHFSTRYNFATHLGIGMNFGAQRAHELVLRMEHFSNAGIRQPNPGENFLQLRYARRF